MDSTCLHHKDTISLIFTNLDNKDFLQLSVVCMLWKKVILNTLNLHAKLNQIKHKVYALNQAPSELCSIFGGRNKLYQLPYFSDEKYNLEQIDGNYISPQQMPKPIMLGKDLQQNLFVAIRLVGQSCSEECVEIIKFRNGECIFKSNYIGSNDNGGALYRRMQRLISGEVLEIFHPGFQGAQGWLSVYYSTESI